MESDGERGGDGVGGGGEEDKLPCGLCRHLISNINVTKTVAKLTYELLCEFHHKPPRGLKFPPSSLSCG